MLTPAPLFLSCGYAVDKSRETLGFQIAFILSSRTDWNSVSRDFCP